MDQKKDLDSLFLKQYVGLNKQQKKAVDTIEGPVMVVAGPGTGKTQILTLRIAEIIRKTDTNPEQILALTFTDSAGKNMRKRLTLFLGNKAYRVPIFTFHGFAEHVISTYPEYFPLVVGSRVADEVEKATLIHSILDSLSPSSVLRPFGDPYFYVADIFRTIDTLKREYLLPEDFKGILEKEREFLDTAPDLYHEKGAYKGKMKSLYEKKYKILEKNEELLYIYREYEKKMKESKRYDFTDMLVFLASALQTDERFKNILQEEYQYILVDEHQDTNGVQNKIVDMLLDYFDAPNLFVVGDPKQAVYRFQGASQYNFLHIKKAYPDLSIIQLSENYRSSQAILNLAESLIPSDTPLISKIPDTESKELVEGGKENSLGVVCASLPSPESECVYIGEAIQKIRKKSPETPLKEIAVLVRRNKDIEVVENVLASLGVPTSVETSAAFFENIFVKDMRTLLECISTRLGDAAFSDILHSRYHGFFQNDVYALMMHMKTKRVLSYRDVTLSEKELSLAGVKNPLLFKNFTEKIALYIEKDTRGVVLADFILDIYHDFYLKNDSLKDMTRSLQILARLLSLAKTYQHTSLDISPVAGFVSYLSSTAEHLRIDSGTSHASGVKILTAHKSKGLEFSHVFVYHVNVGVWGDRKNRDTLKLVPGVYSVGKSEDREVDENTEKEGDEDINQDERNILYVAITRAKKTLMLTYSQKDEIGKELLPSTFIPELSKDAYLFKEEGLDFLEHTYEVLYTNPTVRTDEISRYIQEDSLGVKSDKDQAKSMILLKVHDMLEKKGLSVSQINSYLACPIQWLYTSVLGLPQKESVYLTYGKAMHKTLERACNKKREEGSFTIEMLHEIFTYELGSQKIAFDVYDTLLYKGVKALSVWYATEYEQIGDVFLTEFRIPPTPLPESLIKSPETILVNGAIDRIDFISSRNVRVVDYKTGKPKTRKEIRGETQNSTGEYFRQIVFYKILLSMYKEGKYAFSEGVIDFIEPDEKGLHKKEVFAVTEEDERVLLVDVVRIHTEMRQGGFWDKGCGKKDCTYCTLYKRVMEDK